jgi:hypothetical protein
MTRWQIISDYDWSDWVVGIIRAFVSGAAGAIAAPIGPMAMDPNDWNLASGLHKVLASMAIAGLITGITAMAVFLKTHGAPDKIKQELATAATATQQAGEAIAQAQQSVSEKKDGKPSS